jgi:DNA-binding response OmpR family regulator
VRPPARAAHDEARWILLVEDDDLVASVLKHRLEREGFRVLHFEDGLAALDALETAPAIGLAILRP